MLYPFGKTIDTLFLVHKSGWSKGFDLRVRMEIMGRIHPQQSDCSWQEYSQSHSGYYHPSLWLAHLPVELLRCTIKMLDEAYLSKNNETATKSISHCAVLLPSIFQSQHWRYATAISIVHPHISQKLQATSFWDSFIGIS